MKRIYNRRYIVIACVRIGFALCLALKLDGTESLSWPLVFLPIWIYFVFQFFWASHLVAMGGVMMSHIEQNALPEVHCHLIKYIERTPLICNTVLS